MERKRQDMRMRDGERETNDFKEEGKNETLKSTKAQLVIYTQVNIENGIEIFPSLENTIFTEVS